LPNRTILNCCRFLHARDYKVIMMLVGLKMLAHSRVVVGGIKAIMRVGGRGGAEALVSIQLE
jgi:hypothetical protein